MSLALGRLRPIVTFLAKRNRQVNLATVRHEGTTSGAFWNCVTDFAIVLLFFTAIPLGIITDAKLRIVYRKQFLQEPPHWKFVGTAVSFFLWYWVLYHCWYEFDHLKGHGFPDASKWTDEELGIPPDDEE